MSPTSRQDPEAARRQREAYPPPDEHDWVGLLCGLGLAIGGVASVIACMHLWLVLTT